jgi:hypothetical protein
VDKFLIDKFKINWTEKNKKGEITCVSGYEYQVDSFEKELILINGYKVTRSSQLKNSDGTVTVTFIKTKI